MKFRKAVLLGVTVMIVLITLLCISSSEVLFAKQVTAYTMYIMLGLLGIGMVSFVYNQPRLMMVSLLCCCALNLYLKDSSNDNLRLAVQTTEPSLRISHISLGNAESDYDSVINYLMKLDADFLSFQELTPDWNSHLTDRLRTRFNHIQTMTRLDQYGMGFFSKLPFHKLDTFYFQDIPNLCGSVLLSERALCNIISFQVKPPVSQVAFSYIDQHFASVVSYIDSIDGAAVVLGDFHLPPWSTEVQKFKQNGQLKDGRRDIHPRNIDGSMSLPRIPVEHILYSDDFECTSFSEIGNSMVGRIGITGTYQLHPLSGDIVQ